MKLFGKRQWILSMTALLCGLGLTGYLLNVIYGEIKISILLITGFIGLLIIIILRKYANK
jgi:hypothetical protein